jgi:hypothetical protein
MTKTPTATLVGFTEPEALAPYPGLRFVGPERNGMRFARNVGLPSPDITVRPPVEKPLYLMVSKTPMVIAGHLRRYGQEFFSGEVPTPLSAVQPVNNAAVEACGPVRDRLRMPAL